MEVFRIGRNVENLLPVSKHSPDKIVVISVNGRRRLHVDIHKGAYVQSRIAINISQFRPVYCDDWNNFLNKQQELL